MKKIISIISVFMLSIFGHVDAQIANRLAANQASVTMNVRPNNLLFVNQADVPLYRFYPAKLDCVIFPGLYNITGLRDSVNARYTKIQIDNKFFQKPAGSTLQYVNGIGALSTFPAINTYSAGPGIVKNGSDPSAGFSSDWTTVMSVSRATDSITNIKSNMALKADKSTSITINGVSQDISTSRTWSISTSSYLAGSGIAINSGTITNASPDTWSAVSANYQTTASSDAKYFLKPTGTTSQIILGNGTYTNYPSVPSQYNPSAGPGISIIGSYPAQTYSNTGVLSVNGRTGTVTITSGDVTSALGYTPISAVTVSMVTSALGFTPISSVTGSMVTNALGYAPLSNTVTIPPATTITAGQNVSVSGSSGSFTVSAASATASISGSTLTVGTSTIQLPAGTTYSAGPDLSLSGGVFTNTSPDQTVTISGSTGSYPNFTVSPLSLSTPSAIASGSLTPGTGTASATYTGTAFKIPGNTKGAWVDISAAATVSIGILGAVTATIFVETSPDGTTWTKIKNLAKNNSSLVGLNTTNGSSGTFWLPASGWYRISTINSITGGLLNGVSYAVDFGVYQLIQ